MNLSACIIPPNETPAVVAQNHALSGLNPRIEPREFEQLLQRAMEILNARDLAAQLQPSSGS